MSSLLVRYHLKDWELPLSIYIFPPYISNNGCKISDVFWEIETDNCVTVLLIDIVPSASKNPDSHPFSKVSFSG